MANDVSITITFKKDGLRNYTDEYLVQLFHLCQANPAEIEDRDAIEAAESVKDEIVLRWLLTASFDRFSHQARHLRSGSERNRVQLIEATLSAVNLLNHATDESDAEMGSQGWSKFVGSLARLDAIRTILDFLDDPQVLFMVTKEGSGGLSLWTKLKKDSGRAE